MSTVRPTPGASGAQRSLDAPARDGADEPVVLSVADLVRFFVRNAFVLAVVPLVAGGVAAVVARATLPEVYEARATLVATAGAFRGEDASGRELETFKHLAGADEVLEEVRRRLAKQDRQPARTALRLGQNLEVQSLESALARRREASLVPVLDLVVRNEDAKLAAGIVNTWAGAFVDLNRKLLTETAQRSTQALRRRLDHTRERLAALSEELADVERERRAQLDALAEQATGAELAAAENAQSALAEHDRVTADRLRALTREQHLAAHEAELAALEDALGRAYRERVVTAGTPGVDPSAPDRATALGARAASLRDALAAGRNALAAEERTRAAERAALERRSAAAAESRARARAASVDEIERSAEQARAERQRSIEPHQTMLSELSRQLALAAVEAAQVDSEPLRIAGRASVPTRPAARQIAARAFAVGLGVALLAFVFTVAREALGADAAASGSAPSTR